jgi:hypothetical protein
MPKHLVSKHLVSKPCDSKPCCNPLAIASEFWTYSRIGSTRPALRADRATAASRGERDRKRQKAMIRDHISDSLERSFQASGSKGQARCGTSD